MRRAALLMTLLGFSIFCMSSIGVAQSGSATGWVHPPSTKLSTNPSPNATNPPAANYDEQIGTTFGQDFTSVAYNVTAVLQSDSDGYGPAYLLNGLSDGGYWYQIGLSFDWPYLNGGYNSGFNANYEVFNSSGSSIFPAMGGGLTPLSGVVNNGDNILLNLYFSGGQVVMLVRDWNTGAVASESYTAYGSNFVGISNTANSKGFFTGLMTEWYHVSAYYGSEAPVTYSNPGFALSSAYLWADEYVAPCCTNSIFSDYKSVTFQNQGALQTFSSNGAVSYADAHKFITGSLTSGILTLGYHIVGGGSSYSAPVLSYTYNGLSQTATLTNVPVTYFADMGTNWQISSSLAGGSSNERWETNRLANGTLSAPVTADIPYFHQYLVTFNYSLKANSSSSSPQAPTVQYGQFGSNRNTTLEVPVWADAESWFLYTDPLSGANSTDRWYSAFGKELVNAPGTTITTYYYQFALTISYSVLGGGKPSFPILNGTQSGLPFSEGLTTQPNLIWLDSGTNWSVPNSLGGSNSQERWESNLTGSGTANGSSTVSISYYHQYALTMNYMITGGGTPVSPSVSGTQFGKVFSAALNFSPTTYYLDSGSNWKLPSELTGSSAAERWITLVSATGTVSVGIIAIQISYSHQFFVSAVFGPSSGGSISNSTGWYDAGTAVQLSASAMTGWKLEGWSGSGAGSYSGPLEQTSIATNGPISENATFYPGLQVSAGPSGTISYRFGAQSGTVNAGTSVTVFAPAGTVISLGANPSSLFYKFDSWTPISTGMSSQITEKLESPSTVQASFSLNFITIGAIFGVVIVAGAVLIFVMGKKTKPRKIDPT